MAGTISFSGLSASGIDSSAWVDALVSTKQQTITTLQEEKEAQENLLSIVNDIKSYFTSFQSCLAKLTDAQYGIPTMDLFLQNLAVSSNTNIATATATVEASRQSYDVLVDQLATATKANSGYVQYEVKRATLDTQLGVLGVTNGTVTVNSQSFSVTTEDTIKDLINKFDSVGVSANFDEDKGVFTVGVGIDEIDEGATNLKSALKLSDNNIDGAVSGSLVYVTRDTEFSKLGLTGGRIVIEDKNFLIIKNGDNYTISDDSGVEHQMNTVGDFFDYLMSSAVNAEEATVDDKGNIVIKGAKIDSVEFGSNLLEVLNLTETNDRTVMESQELSYNKDHVADLTTQLSSLGINDTKTLVVGGTTHNITSDKTLGDIKELLNANGVDFDIDNRGVITVDTKGNEISGTLLDALGLDPTKGGSTITSTPHLAKLEATGDTLLSELGVDDSMSYVAYKSDGTAVTTTISGLSNKTIDELIADLKAQGVNASFDSVNHQILIDDGYIEGTLADQLGMSKTTTTYTESATLNTTLEKLGSTGNETLTIDGGAAKTYGKDTTLQTILDDITAAGGNVTFKDGNVTISGVTLGGSIPGLLGLEATTQGSTVTSGELTIVTGSSSTGGDLDETVEYDITLSSKIGDILGTTNDYTLTVEDGAQVTYTKDTTLQTLKNQIEAEGGIFRINEDNTITIDGVTMSGTLVGALGFESVENGTRFSTVNPVMVQGSSNTATGGTTLGQLGLGGVTTFGVTPMATGALTLSIDGGAEITYDSTTTLDDIFADIQAAGGKAYIDSEGYIIIEDVNLEGTLVDALGLQVTSYGSTITSGNIQVATSTTSTSSSELVAEGKGNITWDSTIGSITDETISYDLSINGTTVVYDADTKLSEIKTAIENAGGTMTINSDNTITINGVSASGSLMDALGFDVTDYKTTISSNMPIYAIGEDKIADESTSFDELGIDSSLRDYTVYLPDGTVVKASSTDGSSGSKTIGDWLNKVNSALNTANGTSGVDYAQINNGVITITGGYVDGSLATALGIGKETVVTDVTLTGQGIQYVEYNPLEYISAVQVQDGESAKDVSHNGSIGVNQIESGTASSDINSSGFVASNDTFEDLFGNIDKATLNTTLAELLNPDVNDPLNNDATLQASTYTLKIGTYSHTFQSTDKLQKVIDVITSIKTYDPTYDREFSASYVDGIFTIKSDMAISGTLIDALGFHKVGSEIGYYTYTTNKATFTDLIEGASNGFNFSIIGGKVQYQVTDTVAGGAFEYTGEKVTYETNSNVSSNFINSPTIKSTSTSKVYVSSLSSFSSGSTYYIKDSSDLTKLASLVNSGKDTTGVTFILENDIDMSGLTNFTPIGDGTTQSYIFKGNFYGNGHVIKNLTINQTNASPVGLFGYISNALIQDVGLENVNINAVASVGALVGWASSSTITNTYVSGGSVTGQGSTIGGLVGYNSYSNIDYSYAAVDVTGDKQVGGFAGVNEGEIRHSYSIGNVDGQKWVGGFVGIIGYGSIYSSYSTANVSGDSNVGGFIGRIDGSTTINITNSYSSGAVSGSTNVGSFIGYVDAWSESENLSGVCLSTTLPAVGKFTINEAYIPEANYEDYVTIVSLSLEEMQNQSKMESLGFTSANGWQYTSGTAPHFTTSTISTTTTKTLSPETKIGDLFDGSTASQTLNLTVEGGSPVPPLTFSSTATVQDVIGKLAEYDINATVVDGGKFKVTSDSRWTLSGALASKLFGGSGNEIYTYEGHEVTYTTTTTGPGGVSADGFIITPTEHTGTTSTATTTYVGDKLTYNYLLVDDLKNKTMGQLGISSLVVNYTNSQNQSYTHTATYNQTLRDFIGIIGNGYNFMLKEVEGRTYLVLQHESNYKSLSITGANTNSTLSNPGEDYINIVQFNETRDATTSTYIYDLFDRSTADQTMSVIFNGTTKIDLTFDFLDTIQTVINKLADIGVSASIDSEGRFTASATGTLNFTGDLAERLFGGSIPTPTTSTSSSTSKVYVSSLTDFVAGNTYYISSAADLNKLAELVNDGKDTTDVTFILENDIDMSSVTNFEGIGSAYEGYAFKGTFYGNGHVIKNLKMSGSVDESTVGLFGQVKGATIEDLGLENVNITGNGNVGALIGADTGVGTDRTTVKNVYVNGGTVKSTSTLATEAAGGLIGRTSSGMDISYSYADVDVTSGTYAGGLLGYSGSCSSTIDHSFALGNVTSTGNHAGGLVGIMGPGSKITNSFAMGDVKGATSVGGLAGSLTSSTVSNSYSTGKAYGGTDNGGFVGYAADSTFTDNAYNADTGLSSISGSTNSGISALTLSDLKNESVMRRELGFVPANGWQYTEGLSPHFGNLSGTLNNSVTHKYTGNTVTYLEPGDFITSVVDRTPSSSTKRVSEVTSFSSGSTYKISDASDLVKLAELVNSGVSTSGVTFVLSDSINMTDVDFTSIGTETNKFKGSFYGNGYVISGLSIDGTSAGTGLFGYTEGATIQDVVIDNATIVSSNGNYSGAVVGYATSSTINNIVITNSNISTTYNYAGGLVGWSDASTVQNSYFQGTINAINDVGGLVGYATNSSIIKNSFTDAEIQAIGYVGGLVGYLKSSTIEGSYSKGNINGSSCIGGLVGQSLNSTIKKSFSEGDINASGSNVGGLVGSDENSTISQSFVADLSVIYASNGYVGGLIGKASKTNISDSYIGSGISVGASGSNQYNTAVVIGYASSSVTASNVYYNGYLRLNGVSSPWNPHIVGSNTSYSGVSKVNSIDFAGNPNLIQESDFSYYGDNFASKAVNITEDTTIGDLFQRSSASHVLTITDANGNPENLTFVASDTIEEVIRVLGTKGIIASVSEGKFTVSGSEAWTLSGEVANKLFGNKANSYSGEFVYSQTPPGNFLKPVEAGVVSNTGFIAPVLDYSTTNKIYVSEVEQLENDKTYYIKSKEDLIKLFELSNDRYKYPNTAMNINFVLEADIDMTGVTGLKSMFSNYDQYGGWWDSSVFYGNGHTISNLSIEGGGLFGRVGDSIIRDLAIENLTISPDSSTGIYLSSIGGLINQVFSDDVLIDNVNITGLTINNDSSSSNTSYLSIGGLVGEGYSGSAKIYNSYVKDVEVYKKAEYFGGLIGSSSGLSNYSEIYNSFVDNINLSASANTSGLLGGSSQIDAYDSYAINSNISNLLGEGTGAYAGLTRVYSINGSTIKVYDNASAEVTGVTAAQLADKTYMQSLGFTTDHGWSYSDTAPIFETKIYTSSISTSKKYVSDIQDGDLINSLGNVLYIKSADDLMKLSELMSNYDNYGLTEGMVFILENDIDMSGKIFTPIGSDASSPNYIDFQGTFDGRGHVIKNITFSDSEDLVSIGLFAATYGATIQNIGLENITINSNIVHEYYGGLVGFADETKISNSYVTGNASLNNLNSDFYFGGLVGEGYNLNIDSSYVDLDINLTTHESIAATIGGLIGSTDSSVVSNSYSAGSIYADVSSGADVAIAGIAGATGQSIYKNIYSSMNMEAEAPASWLYVGGFFGTSENDNVSSGYYSGTFNLTNTTNLYAGTILGHNNNGSIFNNIVYNSSNAYDADGSGSSTQNNVVAKSLADMKNQSVMEGLGFNAQNGWYYTSGSTPQFVGSRSITKDDLLVDLFGDDLSFIVTTVDGKFLDSMFAMNDTCTVQHFMDYLETTFGITSSLVDGKLTLTSDTPAILSGILIEKMFGSYTISLSPPNGSSNIDASYKLEEISGSGGSGGGTTTTTEKADENTTVGQLFGDSNNHTITVDGNNLTFSSSDTIQDIFDKLWDEHKIHGSIEDGVISIDANDDHVLTGDLTEKLFGAATVDLIGSNGGASDKYTMDRSEDGGGTTTTTTTLTMKPETYIGDLFGDSNNHTFTINGEDIVLGKDDTIQDLIDKLGTLGYEASVTDGKLLIGSNGYEEFTVSGDLAEKVLDKTGTITSDYVTQEVTLSTSSRMEDIFLDGDSHNFIINKASGGSVTITLGKNDTIQTLFNKLEQNGIVASIADGKLTFKSNYKWSASGDIADKIINAFNENITYFDIYDSHELNEYTGHQTVSEMLAANKTLVTGNRYHIASVQDLQALATYVNDRGLDTTDIDFVLDGDIDLSSVANFVPIGTTSNAFKGNFHGNGNTISNLTINTTSNMAGLFGVVSNATIKDVNLEDVNVKGGSYTGALAGQVKDNSEIINCYSSGTVKSTRDQVGGLLGELRNSTMIDSYSTANVSGNGNVGGLLGIINNSTIERSYATGDVSATAYWAGGLAGAMINGGTLKNSYATGNVNAKNAKGVGGLVGLIEASTGCSYTLDTVYSTGRVYGNQYTGALIGWRKSTSATVSNAVYNTNLEIAGIGSGSTSGVTGKTFVEMQNQSIMQGLGFTAAKGWKYTAYNTPYLGNISVEENGGTRTVSNVDEFRAGDTYYITTKDDLIALSNFLKNGEDTTGVKFILNNDIDMSGVNFAPIGNTSNSFKGDFYGNGHSIDNLTINSYDDNTAGLFGFIEGGHIQDLSVTNATVAGNKYVGILAGYIDEDTTIENTYTTGNVTDGWDVGGLVGTNYGTITSSYSTATVEGRGSVGGLVGDNNSTGVIKKSYATGNVLNGVNAGGLVGFNSSVIETSYATGNAQSSLYAGGFVGVNQGTITNSYSTGIALDGTYLGGFVGYMEKGTISGSVYNSSTKLNASGRRTANNVTGLAYNEMWDKEKMESLGFTADKGWLYADKLTPYLNSNVSFTNGGKVYVSQVDSFVSGEVFYIATKDDLNKLAQLVNNGALTIGVTFVLENDIDMSGVNFTPIGNSTNQFQGNFSGNGYTISNLEISSTNSSVGLFGYTSGAVIRDVSLEDVNISGTNNVGALVGIATNETEIINSYSTGTVIGTRSQIGGLIGELQNSDASYIYSSAEVRGSGNVGGLIGCMTSTSKNITLENSFATGNVIASGTSVGGLVGALSSWNGSSIKSYSATIKNSYATGNVSSSSENVGGLVGFIERGVSHTLDTVYSTGNVSGSSKVGALVGANNSTSAKFTNAIYNSNLSRSAVGSGYSSSSIKGLSLDNIQDQSIMESNGFTSDKGWVYYEGKTPMLQDRNKSIDNSYSVDVSLDTALWMLGDSLISKNISVVVNGNTYEKYFNENDTVEDVINWLNGISDINVSFDESNSTFKVTADYEDLALAGGLTNILFGGYANREEGTVVENTDSMDLMGSGDYEKITKDTTIQALLNSNSASVIGFIDDSGNYITETFEADQTVGDVMDYLESQGFEVSLVNGVFTAVKKDGAKTDLLGAIGSALKGSDGTVVSEGSGFVSDILSSTVGVTADGSTKLSALGVDSGKIQVKSGSGAIVQTLEIDNNMTINDLASMLSNYGFTLSINNGKVTVTAEGDNTLVNGTSNLISKLKLDTWNKNNVKLEGGSTLSQMGFSQGASLGVIVDGKTMPNLTFMANDTLDTIISRLKAYGIEASVDADGKFTAKADSSFVLTGELGSYLTQNSVNGYEEFANGYKSENPVEIGGTITKLTEDTLIGDLLGTGEGGILRLTLDGDRVIDLAYNANDTVKDIMVDLAGYGINTEINDGVLTAISQDRIYRFSGEIGDAISGNTPMYDDISTGYVSKDLSYEIVGTATLDSTLKELGISAGQIHVMDSNNNIVTTLDVDESFTVSQVKSMLMPYGLDLTMDSNGRVTVTTNNGYRISDGTSNMVSKMGLTNWNMPTEKLNLNTTIAQMGFANGADLNLFLDGAVQNILSFDANQTLQDVIFALSAFGIDASVDANGRFTATSDTHTFVMSNSLGSFLTKGTSGYTNFDSAYQTDDKLTEDFDYVTSSSSKLEYQENMTLDSTLESLGFTNGGNVIVSLDGQTHYTLSFLASDTVQDVVYALSAYGIDATVDSNGQFFAESVNNEFVLTGNLGTYLVSGGMYQNEDTGYQSGELGYETIEKVTNDTKLSELGVMHGDINIIKDGKLTGSTINITDDTTVGQLFNAIKVYGMNGSIKTNDAGETYIEIAADSNTYLADGTSNIVSGLGLVSVRQGDYKGEDVIYWEDETDSGLITEDMLLSDFDKNGYIAQGSLIFETGTGDEAVEHIINIASDETVGSLLQKLNNTGVTAVLDNGVIKINAGIDGITFKGGTSGLVNTIGLDIENVDVFASSSSALTYEGDVAYSAANFANGDTKLSVVNVTNGEMNFFVDGIKCTIQVNSEDSFADFFAKVSSEVANRTGLTLKAGFLNKSGEIVVNPTDAENTGIVAFEVEGEHELVIGSTIDTTNFATIANLNKAGYNEVVGSRALYRVNVNSKITESGLFRDGDITEGTFKIGDAEFTIDSNTTLSSLIDQINKSQTAYATAYWDTLSGTMVIQSTLTGASLINIEAGTSNFTDILGFTEEKNGVSALVTDNQTLGKNAIISINGTKVTASSNVITSEVSKIKGLTINLKNVSEGETVTITVERDDEAIYNAVSETIDAYNAMMEALNKELSNKETLGNQALLKLMRNNLKRLMTSSLTGDYYYKNLAAIGITTGVAQDSISLDVTALIIDKDQFLEALDTDDDAVKKLLVGTQANPGIFLQANNIVESSIKSTGYFNSMAESLTRSINNIEKKITQANEDIENYRAKLERNFQNMESAISSMQNSYSAFLNKIMS